MKLEKIKYIFLMILVMALGTQIVYVLSDELTFTILQKILIVFVQVMSIIGFTFFHIYKKNQEKRKQGIYLAHIFIFMIYIINLGYVLLFDQDFGRNAQHLVGFDLVNLEFMRTIQLFIHGYQLGVISLESIIMNILGNVVIFMPMAYFLPIFFKKQRKWYVFFITMSLLVANIEILQMILQTGSADIDDWFLNVIGVMSLYGLFMVTPLKKLYSLLERKEK